MYDNDILYSVFFYEAKSNCFIVKMHKNTSDFKVFVYFFQITQTLTSAFVCGIIFLVKEMLLSRKDLCETEI